MGMGCKGLHITTVFDKLDLTAPLRRVTCIAKESWESIERNIKDTDYSWL